MDGVIHAGMVHANRANRLETVPLKTADDPEPPNPGQGSEAGYPSQFGLNHRG